MRWFLVLALAATLCGCATPYGDMTALGGVRAVRISEDTAQITAAGNAYTDPDTIQRYALRRAAEETVADGFDLFRIVDAEDRTRSGVASFGYANANRYGAFGSAFAAPVIRPGQTLMIKMVRGPRPDPMPDGEYDAHEVLKYLAENDAAQDHRTCKPGPTGAEVCR